MNAIRPKNDLEYSNLISQLRCMTAKKFNTIQEALQFMIENFHMNKTELSRQLGVSKTSIYNWLETGKIPFKNRRKIHEMFGINLDAMVESSIAQEPKSDYGVDYKKAKEAEYFRKLLFECMEQNEQKDMEINDLKKRLEKIQQ